MLQNSDIILSEIEKFLQFSKTNREITDAEWNANSTVDDERRESIELFRKNIIENIKRYILNDCYNVIFYSPDIEKPQKAVITLTNKDKIHIDLVDYFAYIASAPNMWVELEKKLIANELT